MKRTYIWRGRQPRDKCLVLDECRSDEEDGQAILAVPVGTSGEVQMEILAAIRRAYDLGRGDRSAELLPDRNAPADFVRDIVRDEAIGAISEWGAGWTAPVDGQSPRQHYITLENIDETSNTLDLAIGEQRYDMSRRFRVRVLIEDIEQR